MINYKKIYDEDIVTFYYCIGVVLLFLIILSINVTAYDLPIGKTNESIQAMMLIDKAVSCMDEMQQRNISLNRTNESFQQAVQLYSAQIALENQGKRADYKLVNESAVEVCSIRDIALKADDELKVFNDYYSVAGKKINLSSMDTQYSDIIRSFNEQRFEDTLILIDKGYQTLSEVEASQTTLKLFYDTTTRTIKDFFKENWKSLSIGTLVFLIIFIIFWKVIFRFILKRKLEGLYIRRTSIEDLIKKMQYDYFKTKKISEIEFNVKLKSFKDLMREIDREIPEIKESLAKVDKKGFLMQGKKEGKFKYAK